MRQGTSQPVVLVFMLFLIVGRVWSADTNRTIASILTNKQQGPLPALALMLQSRARTAAEPDFYLVMQKCSTTLGTLTTSADGLKTVEGDPFATACTRNSRRLSCRMAFGDQSPDKVVEYTVTLDMPPLLMFADEHGGDFFVVDTVQHRAVVMTRIVSERYAGTKVCQGLFTTDSEVEAVRKLINRSSGSDEAPGTRR